MPAARRSSSSSNRSSAAKPAAPSTGTAAKPATQNRKTAAKSATKQTGTKGGATRTRPASGGADSASSISEQLARGQIKPRDVVILTRERIQEALDDAAARGRVTRKDANDLVAELVRRGRQQGDGMRAEIDKLLERGRSELEAAATRVHKSETVDRVIREADRARRIVGVGPSFPIAGYEQLNARQVQSRLSGLSKPELRKVLNHERAHANRKTVTGALEKALK